MSKSSISLLLSLLLAGPAWPQEDASSGQVGEPRSVETAEAGAGVGKAEEPKSTETADTDAADDIVDPEFGDAELDEQTYEEGDDVFVPSEEIPADEPIAFPSDI